MNAIKHTGVAKKFDAYPDHIRSKMMRLRQLILDTAAESEGIKHVEETLKWGEPSYLAKGGSTVRIDWKPAAPDQYAIYFNCQSRLVETFKELYGSLFKYEGKRAILFQENDEIPIPEFKQCIHLTLSYHRRKHLPLLGA